MHRKYTWTWIWRTQWDQENWSVICKIRRILDVHRTGTKHIVRHALNVWAACACNTTARPIATQFPRYGGMDDLTTERRCDSKATWYFDVFCLYSRHVIHRCLYRWTWIWFDGTRKIGPSYATSVIYIWRILAMHRTGTKHIVRHMQKSVLQWSVISRFTCTTIPCQPSGVLV